MKHVYELGQVLHSIWRLIWEQVSDFCLPLAKKKRKKKEGIVPSLPSSRSPRGEGVDPTFLHADLIKPSAERKTGLDSWPCSTLHSIGASERTWWSKQHAAGNWTQLPRCCLFQGFFSPLPFLPFSFLPLFLYCLFFLSGNKSEELSPTDMILELLVRVFSVWSNSHRLIELCHHLLQHGALCWFFVEYQP